MYLKPRVCSAFVFSDSRSDSSALLDKVGLAVKWAREKEMPPLASHAPLHGMTIRDICSLLTVLHLLALGTLFIF